MRRSLAVMFLVLLPLATAGLVGAAVKPGKYNGTTAQDLVVSFKVTENRKIVTARTRVRLSCTDGDSYVDDDTSPQDLKFPISDEGRFGWKAGPPENNLKVKGRIKGKKSKASGWVRYKSRFNEQNRLDPNGSITCDSGRVSFTAER
jgi:hypothetical protein